MIPAIARQPQPQTVPLRLLFKRIGIRSVAAMNGMDDGSWRKTGPSRYKLKDAAAVQLLCKDCHGCRMALSLQALQACRHSPAFPQASSALPYISPPPRVFAFLLHDVLVSVFWRIFNSHPWARHKHLYYSFPSLLLFLSCVPLLVLLSCVYQVIYARLFCHTFSLDSILP